MKTIIVLLISLFAISCTSSDNGTENSTSQNSPIVGTWSFIYPSTQCIETYIIKSDNTFSATSLDEVFSGTYAFTAQANSSNRHPTSFTVTRDNQQFDCQGSNANNVGQFIDMFSEFPNSVTMNWYSQSTGGTPEITLNKK